MLTELIEDIFHEYEARYGTRRIQQVLLQRNIHVNIKRVNRLMGKHGLVSRGVKKRYPYDPNKTQYEERENILNQVFAADQKNLVWVGDITYIPTRHGFLYLAVFIDVYTRKVTGWAMDTHVRDALVVSAFCQAIGQEHPPEGLIVHTDRGSQYTSHNFGKLLLSHGCRQSMSRKGNPYDNAIMESFYRTLKRELVNGADYDTPEQAQMDVFKYIETYYNTKRIHSTLGYLTPTQFETQNS